MVLPTRPMPPEALRRGDTLVGMRVPLAGVKRAPPCPSPQRPSATLVGMAVPLAGMRRAPSARSDRTSLPLPFLRDEPPPQSGDTVVSLVRPPSIDELLIRLQAEDTATTMQLLLPTEGELWPEDTGATFEVEPVWATESPVDPNDTEVAMWLDPDDAVTMVLEPAEGEPRTLGARVLGLESSIEEAPPASHGEASTSSLERLAQEQPWWLRWAIAAAVLLVLGGTGAWLVQGGEDDEAKATSAVTASSMAASPLSIASKLASRAMEPQREAVERADAVVAVKPAPQALQAPVDGSPAADERARAAAAREAACVDARSRADAGKRKREWVSVLAATRRWGCWRSAEHRVVRARLRVMAFAELGEFERCVAEGSKSRDRKVAARTALCRKELGVGSMPM
jgi:hypothetical protein